MTASPPDPIEAITDLAVRLDDHDSLLKEFDLRLTEMEANHPAGPAVIAWHDLDAEEYARQLAALAAWVTILLESYPHARASVPDCWQAHKDAVTDLGLAWCEFTRIYSRKRPPVADALPYWDRWLPGVLKRVSDATRACRPPRACALKEPSYVVR